MECSKWEELGLLYSARELDQQQAHEFEEHLIGCEECKKELSLYHTERERFFTPELLGEAPSSKIDTEILRVCSDPRKRITGAPVFLSLWRKAVVPAAIFFIAFISVGYVVFNMQNAQHMKSAVVTEEKADIMKANQTIPMPAVANTNGAEDSLKDSLYNPGVKNFAGTRGNLNENGVMTVDLKKDK